jgi:hypothetical protein
MPPRNTLRWVAGGVVGVCGVIVSQVGWGFLRSDMIGDRFGIRSNGGG